MFYLVFSFLLTSSFAQTAGFVGFAHGNNLTATPVQGEVRVTCSTSEGSGSAIYTCRDIVLEPQPYDYFLGPIDSRASKVELTNTRADGSVRIRASAYEGHKGRSVEPFNLWISTLFQKPLLALGKNTVAYKIYSSSHVNDPYAQGSIQVMVAKGVSRRCPPAQYASDDANDCTSQYSICQRYFTQYNQCR